MNIERIIANKFDVYRVYIGETIIKFFVGAGRNFDLEYYYNGTGFTDLIAAVKSKNWNDITDIANMAKNVW